MSKKIEIFEPGMCCPTGLCGPSIDPELLRISTVVNTLEKSNVDIKRYNLISNPIEFISNKVISDMMMEKGEQVLPVTLVDGKVEKQGVYPTNEEFTKWTGVTIQQNKSKIRKMEKQDVYLTNDEFTKWWKWWTKVASQQNNGCCGGGWGSCY